MAGALGHLSTLQRDYEQPAELLEEALARQRELGNDVAVSLAYNFLGQIPLSQGDPDRAARLFTAGLNAARPARHSC
jgi:Tetratricopeptide repeat